MAQIIPLLGGVRGGSLGREISVNISRITGLPTPKSPPKRGLSSLHHRIYKIHIYISADDIGQFIVSEFFYGFKIRTTTI